MKKSASFFKPFVLNVVTMFIKEKGYQLHTVRPIPQDPSTESNPPPLSLPMHRTRSSVFDLESLCFVCSPVCVVFAVADAFTVGALAFR